MSPSWVSYDVSVVRIFEKIDNVIYALHCNISDFELCFNEFLYFHHTLANIADLQRQTSAVCQEETGPISFSFSSGILCS